MEADPDWRARLIPDTEFNKSLHSNPDASVIMIADHDDDALREASFEAGAFAYLLKSDLMDWNQFFRSALGSSQWDVDAAG